MSLRNLQRRVLAVNFLLIGSAFSSLPAQAAPMPAAGTLNTTATTLSYSGGPFVVDNPGGVCQGQNTCENYALSVRLPAGYVASNPNAKVRVTLAGDTGGDFDLQVREGTTVLASGAESGAEMVEVAAGQGARELVIRVIPFLTQLDTYSVQITLLTGDAGGGSSSSSGGSSSSGSSSSSGGSASSSSSGSSSVDPAAPRYKIHFSPPETGNASGEPTLGYNPLTKRVMFMNNINAQRVTFKENLPAPADMLNAKLPESCDAQWESKPGTITTLNTLDPLMYTDKVSGRTFNSQLSGANSLFEYSDDDGDTWTPGQIGPANGGADHQGMVTGPYPAGAQYDALKALYGRAFYYCSQSVATAFCARSDDGAQTQGPGFTFKNTDCAAGGLHGHPQVGPDGRLFIPDASQCVLPVGQTAEKIIAHISTDAGVTYRVSPLPASTGHSGAGSEEASGSDPSIAASRADAAGNYTTYMCYENGDGHLRIATSLDKGDTWVRDVDVSGPKGITRTRFPAAIAGDRDRAACAFLGTDFGGSNHAALDYKGVWYGYIATTYDEGRTFQLVNVTPNDPVQGHGGIGPDGTNRNLLDFNDLEVDERGRVLFGYADGCIGPCVNDPAANSFADKGSVVRQTGGRTLLAAFDNMADTQYNFPAPITPAAACASQTDSLRTSAQTLVAWKAPDNGGTAITNYQVLRSTSAAGPFTFVGDAGAKNSFLDNTADNTVPEYFYRVVAQNAQGSATTSNIIRLAISTVVAADTCTLPGEVIAVSPPTTGAPDFDLQFVAAAEPLALEDNLAITVKVASFSAGQPPPGSWQVRFPNKGNRYVAMDTSQGTPRFVYGTYELDPSGTTDLFTEEGELDERSNFAANGTIVLVVPKALLGNPAVGATLVGFDTRVRAGSAVGTSRDTAGPGSYTLRGTQVCLPNTAPLANLLAMPTRGNSPLTVSFDASGSSDPDMGGSVASYTLDFGDGSPVVTQTSPLFSHVYTNDAEGTASYAASLTVTDNRGLVSSNTVRTFIEVIKEVAQAVAPFNFIERTNVRLNTFITSELITLSGFTGSLPITVTEGLQYSIDGGPFTNAAGMVMAGQKIAVRHVSANAENTARESTLTIGSGEAAYSTVFRTVTTTLDRVPDAFDFGTKSNQANGQLVESDAIVLKGYDVAGIVAGPGMAYSLNGAAYTTAKQELKCGNADKTLCTATLKVRHTANSASLGYTKSTLTVGGVKGTFTTRSQKK